MVVRWEDSKLELDIGPNDVEAKGLDIENEATPRVM